MSELMVISKEDYNALRQDLTEIKQLLKRTATPEIETRISHKEAAKFLNIHRNTLTERIENGTYPKSIVHMNGSRKEYYRSELAKL